MKVLNMIGRAGLLAVLVPLSASAQLGEPGWRVTMQTTNGWGDHTPLWQNANRYGMGSTQKNNGYLQAGVYSPVPADSVRRWGFGYGLSLVGAWRAVSPFYVQEAYAEARWLKGTLTVGSKEYPMELKNNRLSSGSQTLGINARPVPQVRLALPRYWTFAKGWLGLKGHIAYGIATDGGWQERFTTGASRYSKKVLYHSKAGYLKVGNTARFPLSVELGLESACLFGGDFYRRRADGGLDHWSEPHDFGAFVDAFLPNDKNKGTDSYMNVPGNQIGSWVARVSYEAPSWQLGVYVDHFFEDHSAMFFADYDGYGEGDRWNVKENNRYLTYGLKDLLLGAELKLKRFRYINNVVLEYVCTKYQSGPIFHDHTAAIPDHLGGRDDYYNHTLYVGWQHWGQVMGNPLYRSPLYNTNGEIYIEDNRFVAWHAGVSGDPAPQVGYRLLATLQKGYGTYARPYPDPRRNFSLLAEATYTFAASSALGGWAVTGSFGLDSGRLLGGSGAFQLTLTKTGGIHFNKKRK